MSKEKKMEKANQKKTIELISFSVENWNQTEYHQREIDIIHDSFKRMSENNERNIIQNKQEVHKIFELKSNTNDEYDLYFAELENELELRVNNELEKRFRFSSFISIISYIESKLNYICKGLEDDFKFTIKLKDLNSKNDLSKFKLFLFKVLEIDPIKIKNDFDKLILYYQIRNYIIHHDGNCIGNNLIECQNIKNTFRTIPGIQYIESSLSLNSNNSYSFAIVFEDEKFIENLLIVYKSFFKNLLECIENRIFILNKTKNFD